MKTTITLVLTAAAIVGLCLASSAVAQDTSRYATEAVPQQGVVQAGGVAPGLQPKAAQPVVSGQYNPSNAYPSQQPGVGGYSQQPAANGVQTAAAQPAGQAPCGQAPCGQAPCGQTAGNSATTPDSVYDNGLWPGAAETPGCSICGGGNCTPADWYLEESARVLYRSRARDQVVGYHYTSGTMAECINTRTVNPGISGIWEMTVGHYFARDTENRDHFVEFTFWGLNNWSEDATLYGNRLSYDNGTTTTKYGNLYSAYVNTPNGTDLKGFSSADEMTVQYSSYTNNFEINGRIVPRGRPDREVFLPDGHVRRECQPGTYMSYLYGLRFFQLNETYKLHSESLIEEYNDTTGNLTSANEYTGDYGVVTHNNLLGLQVGADLTFRDCRWAWGFYGKAGPYINFSDTESNIHSDEENGLEFERRVCASKHGASFIGETGVQASYKFRPTLVGRVSYDLMWVTGVALAPDQLNFYSLDPQNKINTNGTAFMHGVSLGLEWQW